MNLASLSILHARLRNVGSRYRVSLTILAILVFLGGAILSARELDFAAIRVLPVLINLLILGPIMLGLSAVGLQQLARLSGTQIRVGEAIRVVIYGAAAELLPIPGSAIARGAALVKSGAGIKKSAVVMAWSTVQTLGLSGMIGAAPVILVYPVFGWIMGGTSVCLFAASVLWMKRQTGNVLTIVSVKVAMIIGSTLRAILGFAAIGHPIAPIKSLVFAIEGALTAIVGIAPAGIGVGEVFSAAVALTVAVPPAAAFLAKAANRLIGLIFLGMCLTAIGLLPTGQVKKPRRP